MTNFLREVCAASGVASSNLLCDASGGASEEWPWPPGSDSFSLEVSGFFRTALERQDWLINAASFDSRGW